MAYVVHRIPQNCAGMRVVWSRFAEISKGLGLSGPMSVYPHETGK